MAVPSQAGGAARTARRLAAGALATLLLLLAALVGAGLFATNRLHTTARDRFLREAFPLRVAARDVVLQMLNEQTGVRGYVVTADAASLAPYRRGRTNVNIDIADIDRLGAGRPRLAAALADVREQVHTVEASFARQSALVRVG